MNEMSKATLQFWNSVWQLRAEGRDFGKETEIIELLVPTSFYCIW